MLPNGALWADWAHFGAVPSGNTATRRNPHARRYRYESRTFVKPETAGRAVGAGGLRDPRRLRPERARRRAHP